MTPPSDFPTSEPPNSGPPTTQTLTADDLEKLANLQLLARRTVEGFCAGLHRSPHKGSSAEFKQHRAYVPGDEIRRLDWKVFGKTDRFYIRQYEDETNLRATLLLDCSGSMAYAGESTASAAHGPQSKLLYAVRLAACIAHLLLRQQDAVGLVTFDREIRRRIPPRARAGHLRALLAEMAVAEPSGESGLPEVVQQLAPKLHRRGLVIVLSDCFCDVPALMQSLSLLQHARHEVLLFQIWDRDELEFPFQQWTRFECLEVTDHYRLTDPAHLRTAYLENVRRFREELTSGCRQRRIDLVSLTTDTPYADALSETLARRSRKRGRPA